MSEAKYIFTCERDEYGWTTYISLRDPVENERFIANIERLTELLKERWIRG